MRQTRIFWLFIALLFSTGVAQGQEDTAYIINAEEGPITFYRIDSDHSLTPVGQLPDEFSISGLSDSDRRVLGWAEHNFSLSPDGKYIAFTADTLEDQTVFLIYSMETNEVSEKFVADFSPFATQLHWSPNSKMVLIEPKSCDCTGYKLPYPETYVYDVESEVWVAVTTTPRIAETETAWRTDSQQIALSSHREGVYVSSPDGSSRQQLFDIYEAVSSNFYAASYATACNFAWSDKHNRWYYEFGCLGIDQKLDYVFSFDLQGNARLEANLPELLMNYPSPQMTTISASWWKIYMLPQTAQFLSLFIFKLSLTLLIMYFEWSRLMMNRTAEFALNLLQAVIGTIWLPLLLNRINSLLLFARDEI